MGGMPKGGMDGMLGGMGGGMPMGGMGGGMGGMDGMLGGRGGGVPMGYIGGGTSMGGTSGGMLMIGLRMPQRIGRSVFPQGFRKPQRIGLSAG